MTELVLACGRGDKTSLNAVLSDLRENIRVFGISG